MMLNIFKRKKKWTDEAKSELVDLYVEILDYQRSLVPDCPIEQSGRINGKALGYVYGWIDAGLRIAGLDMSDGEVGIPITYQVLRKLYPGKEVEYLTYLSRHMGHDPRVSIGAANGGQEHLDVMNQKEGFAATGFAKFLAEGSSKN